MTISKVECIIDDVREKVEPKSVEHFVSSEIEKATGIPITKESKINPSIVSAILKEHGFEVLGDLGHSLFCLGYGNWFNQENNLTLKCGEVIVFWSIVIEQGVITPLGTVSGINIGVECGNIQDAQDIADKIEEDVFLAATNRNGEGEIRIEFKHKHRLRGRSK